MFNLMFKILISIENYFFHEKYKENDNSNYCISRQLFCILKFINKLLNK